MRMKITRLPGDRYVLSFNPDITRKQMEEMKRAWDDWLDDHPKGGIGSPLVMGMAVDFEDRSATLEDRVKTLEEMLS